MHRLLVPVGAGQPMERGDRSSPQCLPLPVHCAQSTVSAYTDLDCPVENFQQLCSALRTGTRWPLTRAPCPPGTKKGLGKACLVAVVLGPWLKLPLCTRIWGWAEMRVG